MSYFYLLSPIFMRGFGTFLCLNTTSPPVQAKDWNLASASGILHFLSHNFIFWEVHIIFWFGLSRMISPVFF